MSFLSQEKLYKDVSFHFWDILSHCVAMWSHDNIAGDTMAQLKYIIGERERDIKRERERIIR